MADKVKGRMFWLMLAMSVVVGMLVQIRQYGLAAYLFCVVTWAKDYWINMLKEVLAF